MGMKYELVIIYADHSQEIIKSNNCESLQHMVRVLEYINSEHIIDAYVREV